MSTGSLPSQLLRTTSVLTLLLCQVASFAAERVETPEPLPAKVAALSMTVPEGFQVKLFAGEPDVKQPIGMAIDDRGRLWVAEAYSYPRHATEGNDQIVILEDTNGDGTFDHRTLFYDKLNYVTGIEVGFGGVWVMSPPYFYFIPDRNGDDVPDSPPELLLDGFGNHANSHNIANGFAWGPDGWLYGTHGRTNWSLLGKPGTPKEDREQFDGGVWRYHPTRHVWEPYADGTTNPWGIDWDDYGSAFVCNCVNPHLFQVIQGAHYEPWRGRKSSQYAYERIDTIADHLHYIGQGDYHAGIGSEKEHDLGGGHAHCGTMVYLGDNWPEKYRNTVFMHNIHGRRINNDILTRHGSGYTASHGADFMLAADPWYMGVSFQTGPGGEVYVTDWSDTGECHSVRNTRKHTGRIYRITHGDLTVPRVDLQRCSDAELVAYQSHKNDWYVRHARRLLQERFAAGRDMGEAHAALHQLFATGDVSRKLRALWTLHVTGGASQEFLTQQLSHESEYVKGWAVQLLCEQGIPSAAALTALESLAAGESTPLVRLYLASALQRLPSKQRWPIAEALAQQGADADDQNLPHMLWYGVEPLIAHDRGRLVALAASTEIPLVRRHIARRVASEAKDNGTGLNELVLALAKLPSTSAQLELLEGIMKGLEGRRRVPVPAAWPVTYAQLQRASDDSNSSQVAARAMRLALIFDDRQAQQQLLATVANGEAKVEDRQLALAALGEAKVEALAPLLLDLVVDESLQIAALRGLARYDHPSTATRILAAYPQLPPAARQTALQTLSARPAWGEKLLDAMEAGIVERTELNAYTARQLQSLKHPEITARLRELWGELRTSSKERTQLIAQQRELLTPAVLATADLSAGRALFEKTCGKCHTLFGTGGKIGPDITGAQRHNLEYLLENVIDPSAAVSRDYLTEIVQMVDGRVISGLVVSDSDQSVTIQTLEEPLVIPSEEIEARRKSTVSMMPENLLQPFTPEQVRDLFGYLQSKSQVALP